MPSRTYIGALATHFFAMTSLARHGSSKRSERSVTPPLTPAHEMVVDLLRHRLADAVDGLEVGEVGAADGLGAAEKCARERAFAGGADAAMSSSGVAETGLGAFRAVGADGEAVSLVAPGRFATK